MFDSIVDFRNDQHEALFENLEIMEVEFTL
jgi:hypothetical protein